MAEDLRGLCRCQRVRLGRYDYGPCRVLVQICAADAAPVWAKEHFAASGPTRLRNRFDANVAGAVENCCAHRPTSSLALFG